VLLSFVFTVPGYFITEGTGFRIAVLFILLYLLIREKNINESIFYSF